MMNDATNLPFDVSVEQLLSAVFGEENAARVCALMGQVGTEGEEIIMLLIQEILQRCEQIQEKDEIINYLRRQLFGQKSERYIAPNQAELFPDSVEPEQPQAEPLQEVEPKERSPKKPRVLFTPERIKGLPIKVIEIDPEGDLL